MFDSPDLRKLPYFYPRRMTVRSRTMFRLQANQPARGREGERGRVCSAAGRLVLLVVNQASLLSLASPACQQPAGSSWLPVRIQALAVPAGTTVTVTGLRRMP